MSCISWFERRNQMREGGGLLDSTNPNSETAIWIQRIRRGRGHRGGRGMRGEREREGREWRRGARSDS
eukprot:1406488-Rhodomonas_salina.3